VTGGFGRLFKPKRAARKNETGARQREADGGDGLPHRPRGSSRRDGNQQGDGRQHHDEIVPGKIVTGREGDQRKRQQTADDEPGLAPSLVKQEANQPRRRRHPRPPQRARLSIEFSQVQQPDAPVQQSRVNAHVHDGPKPEPIKCSHPGQQQARQQKWQRQSCAEPKDAPDLLPTLRRSRRNQIAQQNNQAEEAEEQPRLLAHKRQAECHAARPEAPEPPGLTRL
jgi:hypothetical protein